MPRSTRSRNQRRQPQTRRYLLSRRSLFAAAGLAACLAAIAAAVLVLRGGGGAAPAPARSHRAIIVDQLMLTQPNAQFVSAARDTLTRAGYAVDYVKGEDVTVNFYRTLPQAGYDIVVLRVHAGITTEVSADTGAKAKKEYVSLFTGERYDPNKYPLDQMNRLGKATYYAGGDPLFGIGPEFVEQSMDGDFNGATVVMMGCDGLRSQTTGQAFLDRGAGAFISWSKPVSAEHTDDATLRLLQHLVTERLTVKDAVARTSREVGPDPTYKGELRLLSGS